MNWKLITIILVSLILLIVCYLTLICPLDIQKYFTNKKIQEKDKPTYVLKKMKIDIPNEEYLKNIKLPENHIAYYFFSKCPEYKQEYFLVDHTVKDLEKYHVPEQGHLIIVKKDHKWTKEPNFEYWKTQ